MNKRRLSIALTVFFLVQVILPIRSFSATGSPLSEAKLPNSCFKQLYNILCLSLAIYKSDALQNCSREDIARMYGNSLFNSEVRFDLANIDMGKKGWTRYYLFSVGEEQFIARVFLTAERPYQPKVSVLYEASVMNPAVTVQVLPGLNTILEQCRIKPHVFQPLSRAVETSP